MGKGGIGRAGVLAGIAVAVAVLALPGTASAEVGYVPSPFPSPFAGMVTPRKLPRDRLAPMAMQVIIRVRGGAPRGELGSPLTELRLALSKHLALRTRDLPRCGLRELRRALTREPLKACRRALVGSGSISYILDPSCNCEIAQFFLAFNGRYQGRPAIFVPFEAQAKPASRVLIFKIARQTGTFRTSLAAHVPRIDDGAGRVVSFRLRISRKFRVDGRALGFLSGSCPAPRGFPGANFPIARMGYSLADRTERDGVLVRECRVRR